MRGHDGCFLDETNDPTLLSLLPKLPQSLQYTRDRAFAWRQFTELAPQDYDQFLRTPARVLYTCIENRDNNVLSCRERG